MQPRTAVVICPLASLVLLAASAAPVLAQEPGEVVSELKISQTAGGFAGTLHKDDRFGGAIARVGDLDGDGFDDLLVGAPFDSDGASKAGAVWVLFLDATGAVRQTRKISATQGNLQQALHPNDHFGSSIAALGDIDGDGVPDAAVGAPEADPGTPQAGAVFVLRLTADGTVKASTKLGEGSGGFGGQLSTQDDFGSAVASLGDLDLDGVTDLAVGAPGDDDGAPHAGAAWILFLQADGSVRDELELGAGHGGFSAALDSGDGFGSALASVGDLDGDGRVELAVGAPGDDEGGADAGAVWILHLGPDGTTQGQDRIASQSGGLPTPLAAGDRFGRALAALGDLDGDGHGDLAVGLPGSDAGGTDRGALRLLRLASGSSVVSQVLISSVQGGFGGALDAGDEFGIAVAATPADSSGEARLFTGAWRDDDGGSNFGATWVLQLQGSGSPAQPYQPFLTTIGGNAGQPALLLPPPPAGDDFIGDPVVVVPTSGNTTAVESIFHSAGGVGFTQEANVGVGALPVSAVVGHFNADAHLDVLTANAGSDSISLLVQTSGETDSGAFFAPKIDTALPFDGNPVALRAGDMNGDGDLDAVTAGDAGLTTFLGDGAGNLLPSAFVAVAELTDLRLGDLDGDGDLDVVSSSGAVALGPGSEIGHADSLRNDGTGDLAKFATFATGKAVASVLMNDFDASGTLDVLLAVHELDAGPDGVPQGRLDLWLGSGAATFSLSPVFAGLAVPDADGNHPRWGATADITGDGLPDAVYTSTHSIAFPEDSLAPEQAPVALTVLIAQPGGGLQDALVPTAYVGTGVAPLLHDLAPVPGDGHADCILVWSQDAIAGDVDGPPGGSAPSTFLAALVGDGLGGFQDASPNQFLGAEEPGDPTLAEVGVAPGDAGDGLDLLLPDLATRSLHVWLGDGTGLMAGPLVTTGVDPVDADSLPGGGIWQGGPRSVAVLELDGAPGADVALYSRWDDVAGLFPSQAGFVTRHGDGSGHFGGGAAVLLPAAGELAAGDVGGDGLPDIAVTLRTGGTDSLAIYPVAAGGALQPPRLVALPAGYELTGGLELRNVNGVPGDEVVTSGRAAGVGAVLIVAQVNGILRVVPSPLGTDWGEVRSLDVGAVDADTAPDVTLGLADGSLLLAKGDGAGGFVPLPTGPTAAAVGGGALRLTEINGDGRSDIIAASASEPGTLDQAFVRELLGAGNGSFEAVTLPGISSVGAIGSIRPAAADLDDDGATDLVLAHGGSGNVSVLLNQLSTFQSYGLGKPGTGGVVPKLKGKGYTTLGGTISIELTQALPGAAGVLWLGTDPTPNKPWFAIGNVALTVPITVPVADGESSGSWTLLTHIPNDTRYAGLSIVLQVALADPGATGPGPQGLATTNGVALTILP